MRTFCRTLPHAQGTSARSQELTYKLDGLPPGFRASTLESRTNVLTTIRKRKSVQRGLLWGDAREGCPANGKAPGEVDRPGPAPPTPPSGGFQGCHRDNAATPNVRVWETAQKSGLNCATLTSRLTNVHRTTLLVPQPRPPVAGFFCGTRFAGARCIDGLGLGGPRHRGCNLVAAGRDPRRYDNGLAGFSFGRRLSSSGSTYLFERVLTW